MLSEYKEKIQQHLDALPDTYAGEILQFLQFLTFRMRNAEPDRSSMLLSEQALAKEWLTPEEDEAWQHL